MSGHRVALQAGDRLLSLGVTATDDGYTVASVGEASEPDGGAIGLRLTPLYDGHYHAMVGERQLLIHHAIAGRTHYLHVDGAVYTFELDDGRARARKGRAAGAQDLSAPMPGLISRVLVEVGQLVEANQPLYGLEAMKMETLIRTNQPGRVSAVHVEPGTQVEGGARVVDLAPLEDET